MKIGWIGLGAMGLPMALHLAREGFEVVAYDANPAVTIPDDSSVRLAESPATAAADVDLVVVMVATPAQADAVVDGFAGAIAVGTTVIVMATIGPEAASRLATRVEAAGGLYVDAPVSGGVARAGTGDLLIMAGGNPRSIASATPVLEALSASWHHVGVIAGDGQRMKLVNQLLCGVHIAAAAEALAFAERLGINPAAALDVVAGGAAASFMLSDRGPRMVAADFDPPRSAIDLFVKDLGLVVEAVDLALPLASTARERFSLAGNAGLGRHDDSSVILTYRDDQKAKEQNEQA